MGKPVASENPQHRTMSRRTFSKTAGGGLLGAAAPAILGATDKAGARPPRLGSGAHTYEAVHDWGAVPDRIRYGNTHGVCVDSNGYVYIHHTVHESSDSNDTMVVFDADGRYVTSWGAEFKTGAHGLHIVREGSEEFLFLCDTNRCVVVKATLRGEVVFTLGYPQESDAYRPGSDGQPIRWKPTNLAIGPNGDIYVADGYGSSYIVQYDRQGRYVRTFGGKGTEPGQLNCPHGIRLDRRGADPLLVVADRSNHRLQYFTLDGRHHRMDEGVHLPCHFDIYGEDLLVPDLAARVSILDSRNRVITHLGEGADDWRERRTMARDQFLPGRFICPHSACYDHAGNIYVVEWVEVGRVTRLRKVG